MSTVEEFKKNSIVSDVIPTAPEKRIRVTYDSGVEVSRGRFYYLFTFPQE